MRLVPPLPRLQQVEVLTHEVRAKSARLAKQPKRWPLLRKLTTPQHQEKEKVAVAGAPDAEKEVTVVAVAGLPVLVVMVTPDQAKDRHAIAKQPLIAHRREFSSKCGLEKAITLRQAKPGCAFGTSSISRAHVRTAPIPMTRA